MQSIQHDKKPLVGELPDFGHPQVAGIIGWWLMNAGGGSTLFDLSPNRYDGVSAGSGNRWSTGQWGPATEYDGSTDVVVVGDVFQFGNASSDSPFSISAWIKMDDATGFAIITKATNSTTGTAEWIFNVNPSDKLSFFLYDDNTGHNIRNTQDGTLTASENVWIHVAATYDGSGSQAGITLYLNGQVLASTVGTTGTYVAMHGASVDVEIGRRFKNNAGLRRYANGKMDDLRVYDRELSGSEILDIMIRPFLSFDRQILLSSVAAPAPTADPMMFMPF